jgi:hypothetical protein
MGRRNRQAKPSGQQNGQGRAAGDGDGESTHRKDGRIDQTLPGEGANQLISDEDGGY